MVKNLIKPHCMLRRTRWCTTGIQSLSSAHTMHRRAAKWRGCAETISASLNENAVTNAKLA